MSELSPYRGRMRRRPASGQSPSVRAEAIAAADIEGAV